MKRLIIRAALALFALAPALPVSLSVQDAVDIALENNVSVKRGEITLGSNERDKSHSWNSISPSLKLGADYSRPTEPTDNKQYEDKTTLSASINFSFSPSLFTSIKTARLNYEKGLISFGEVCRSVELSVRTSFYSILYEIENLELQKRNLETARQQYETNKAKYNAGRIPQLDVLTSQVTYEKRKPTVEAAETTLQNDLSSFKQLLGIDVADDVALSGSLDDVLSLGDVALPQNIDNLVARSSSVMLLEKQLEASKTSLLASRFSAYGPTATAGWSYGKTSTDPVKGDKTTAESATLSLGVSIPLDGFLPWSTKADNVSKAKDTIADLELQLQDEKTSVSVSIENYMRQIKQAQSTIKSLEANIDLAQQSYKMTEESYNHGTKDLLSLQTSSDSLLEAQVSLKQEAYTLIKAILNLENITGEQFGTLGAK